MASETRHDFPAAPLFSSEDTLDAGADITVVSTDEIALLDRFQIEVTECLPYPKLEFHPSREIACLVQVTALARKPGYSP